MDQLSGFFWDPEEEQLKVSQGICLTHACRFIFNNNEVKLLASLILF